MPRSPDDGRDPERDVHDEHSPADQSRPERFEYRLTDKGLALWPVIVGLLRWGDEHYPTPDGVPRILEHRGCGGAVDGHLTCERCGARRRPRDVPGRPRPARGAAARP